MELNAYSLCPCGSGKKLKFCCSHDLLGDLQKFGRSVEGQQFSAAASQLDTLISAKGARPALLALKVQLHMALENFDVAEQAGRQLKAALPQSPIPDTHLANIAIERGDVPGAVSLLQRAIERTEETFYADLLAAYVSAALEMERQGYYLAARGHLLLAMQIAPENDEEIGRAWFELNSSRRVPLLLKFSITPDAAPAFAGREDYEAAMKLVGRGRWRMAAERLDALNQRYPSQPAVLRTFAILQGWLADHAAAAAAWRKYSQIPHLAEQDAIEAEAIAQILTEGSSDATLDRVHQVWEVKNVESLLERLLSDRRISRLNVDPRQFVVEGEPPPKGVFLLLDRPLPESWEGLTRESTPRGRGQLLVYGRQTDRSARLEWLMIRDEDSKGDEQRLREVCGESLGAVLEETVVGKIPRIGAALQTQYRLPNDSPEQLRHEILEANFRWAFLELWPSLPQAALGGKAPRDVVGNEAYRVRLAAAALVIEARGTLSPHSDRIFAELREQLGLPQPEPLVPQGDEVLKFQGMRLLRLDASKLADSDLERAFILAITYGVESLAVSVSREVITRDSPALKSLDKTNYYGVLANAAADVQQRLSYLALAADESRRAGNSPARWLLDELTTRIEIRDSEGLQRVLNTLRAQHMNEPGVAETLYQILASYGLVRPAAGAAPAEAAVRPAEPPARPGLWTPGSPAAAAPAAGAAAPPAAQKSKLWLPGMD